MIKGKHTSPDNRGLLSRGDLLRDLYEFYVTFRSFLLVLLVAKNWRKNE